jgi:AcrR family transcriptional regulator
MTQPDKPMLAEKVTGMAEKLTSKVARQATKISQKADQISAQANKVAAHAEKLDRATEAARRGRSPGKATTRTDSATKTARLAALPSEARTSARSGSDQRGSDIGGSDQRGSSTSSFEVWSRTVTGSRKPRFTREDIAATAVRVADAEGLEAISMRRLATELDAGTMTLYYYVHTKDELLTLMIDAVMSEGIDPLPQGDWRSAVTQIARRSKQMLQAHPWILEINDSNGFGPNAVRHFDQTLEAVARRGGSLEDQLDLATAVDEYVFGYCMMHASEYANPDAHSGGAMITYVTSLLGSGDYPRIEAMAKEWGMDKAWQRVHRHSRDEDRFERNLARLLDGFDTKRR